MTAHASSLRRSAMGLIATLALVAGGASAQEEVGLEEDDRTLADEIPDVEIPDVRIGANDAVIHEVEEPPPVAVFEEPAFGQTEPALDEEPGGATADTTGTTPALEMGAEPTADAASSAQRVTGNISAVDLEDGTLEIDTDTRGTLRLSVDRVRLRQIAPGQSVSLSYVDRDDGRWVAELDPLPTPAPPAPADASESNASSGSNPSNEANEANE